ncbi:MAG: phosphoribosylglycinamide formyltransferase [Deltaproteobacteria bacterium CG07_land_8_20_14_0_80_38_7]|nr:MAG: phosphoribosylglycinamide formyltransferase [Deltaproteobacteria bacterium CG07_land_8_20_14_0_80_38_7]
MANKVKLGALASGQGTNLQSIINACERKEINAEITIVISDQPQAMALQRAKKHSIPTAIHERKKYKTKKEFERAIAEDIEKAQVNLICLAGFMRIISPDFINTFKNKIINIHPSLLPSFPGLEAQKQALEYGVKFTGCTVHFVDELTDHGPIILQAAVPVMKNDTLSSLKERILKEEHKIYPKAIQLITEGKTHILDRRVIIS